MDTRTAIAGYVRERLRTEERAHGRGYQAHVARRSKLSTAHVANVMSQDHRGIGIDAAAKLAVFWNLSLEQLTAAALEWAAHRPPSSGTRPTPNLEAALAFMRGRGEMSEEVEAKARRIAEGVHVDLKDSTWISVLRDLYETSHPAPAPTTQEIPTVRSRRTG